MLNQLLGFYQTCGCMVDCNMATRSFEIKPISFFAQVMSDINKQDCIRIKWIPQCTK